MWPIPVLDHEFVCISFSPDFLSCSWIQKAKTGTAPLLLRAYKQYSLNNLELENLTIFNPTIIQQHIASFLHEYNLHNAFVAFCLHGSGVKESFVAMPTSTPHRSDFGISQSSNMLWEYRYLYPHDHGQYVFYVYAVARPLVLQYQLLAIAAQCNVITITTQTMGLIDAYKSMFGAAFRRSQLAVDMMRYGNQIDKLISSDALRRMIAVPTSNAVIEKLDIAAACGLFSAERIEK